MAASVHTLRSLEVTFGKIPKCIEEHMKYLIYNETSDSFTCIPCDKIIKKVCDDEDSTTINFNAHLRSKRHEQNTVTMDTLLGALTKTFLGKIPKMVLNNIYVLGMNYKNYTCEICVKFITVNKYPSVTEENFSHHLLSRTHEENLETYRESLSQLQDVYKRISPVILNNSQFLRLSKTGKSYVCTICKEPNSTILMIDPDNFYKTKADVEEHLYSLEHLKNADQEKAFQHIPQLEMIFSYFPNFILRNIEYIRVYGEHLFCCLCNINIQFNQYNEFLTEHELKLHILSTVHEQKLYNRRDTNNNVFNRLHEMFEIFSGLIIENIKYLTLCDNNLSCSICEEFLDDKRSGNETTENIQHHFSSSSHSDKVCEEMLRQSGIIEELEHVFGKVPALIVDNVQHIECRGKNGLQCVLCNDSMVSNKSFKRHLLSTGHRNELKTLESLSERLQTDLEGIFTSIPQFIRNNWDYLGYEDDSDDFHCFLCDETINVVTGTNKEELTMQNFRNHLLSSDHFNFLKQKANVKMEIIESLEYIFGGIPHFILSNIEHIYKTDDEFYCRTCNVCVVKGASSETMQHNFYLHLTGPCHKFNARKIEDCSNDALQLLDVNFNVSLIPEFLLRNIDFLCTSGDDLFCVLCQKILQIDSNDLSFTKESLQCHMDSAKHLHNLNNV